MSNATQIVITAKDETSAAINSVKSALGGLESKAVALGPLFGAMTAALSFSAFKSGIDGAIAFAARLDDMSESTGATVENLSALAGVAKISGQDLQGVEAGLQKLAKALHGTDEESKGAGKALAAIGLNIKDLKTKDTADAMLDVAKALAEFEDGSGKTAVAIALLGKNGAALLPFLKDLAEKSELVGKITGEQAAMAEQYEKNMVKLSSSFGVFSKTVAMELLPFLTKLTDEMVAAKEESGSFAGMMSGGVRTALETIAVLGVNVAYVFKATGREIGGIAAQLVALGSGDFKGFNAISEAIKADAEKARQEVDALSARLLNRDALFGPDPADAKNRRKKSLKDVDTSPDKKTKTQVDEAANLIDKLNEQITAKQLDALTTEKQTAAEKEAATIMSKLRDGTLETTEAQRIKIATAVESLLVLEKQITAQERAAKVEAMLAEYRRNGDDTVKKIERESALMLMTDRQRAIAEAMYKVEEDGAKMRERIIRDIPEEIAQKEALAKAEEELAKQKERVAQATGKSVDDQRTFAFGWQKAFNRYTEDASNAAKTAENIFTRATDSMGDALADFAMTGKLNFSNLANSILSDIIRVQARQLAAPITAGVGDWFSGLFKNANGGVYNSPSLSQYSGGVYNTPQVFAFAKGAGVFGEAGPEAIMPLSRGSDGKLGVKAQGGGANIEININNTANGTQATASSRSDAGGKTIIDVLIEQVKGAIASDIGSGGMVAGAMEGQYGLNRAAGAWR